MYIYIYIDNNEGLRIVEEDLEKRATKNTPSFAVTLLMKLVLTLNNFVFNGVNFLQKKGTAMGTRAAPNFANVFMGYFENRWFQRFIKSWWRYIDDIPYLFGLAPSLRLAPSLGLAPPLRLQILISAPSSFFVIKRLFVWLAFNFSFSNSFTMFIILGSTQNKFFFIIAVPDTSIFMCLYNALVLISCFLSIFAT